MASTKHRADLAMKALAKAINAFEISTPEDRDPAAQAAGTVMEKLAKLKESLAL